MNDRNQQIIKLWNANLSSKNIAIKLGITKNIVIGVITRERESGRGLITREKLPGPYDGGLLNGKRIRREQMKMKLKAPSLPKLFLVKPEPEKQQTKIVGISLIDLCSDSCRFPVSRVNNQHYFCGVARRDSRTSYCAEHHAMSFVKRRKLTPEELSELKRGYAMKQWLKGSEAATRVS